MPQRQRRIVIALAAATAAVLGTTHLNHDAAPPETTRYIVSADSVATAAQLVADVDGLMIGELAIINAIDADLTAEQVAALQAAPSVSVFADTPVETSCKKKDKKKKKKKKKKKDKDNDTSEHSNEPGTETQQVAAASDVLAGSATSSATTSSGWQDISALTYAFLTDLSNTKDAGQQGLFGDNENVSADAGAYTAYADQVGARELHAMGITGLGVTIAVVDSGIWDSWMFNGIDMRLRAEVDTTGATAIVKTGVGDDSGHGSHVTSVAASNRWAFDNSGYEGIAPGAGIVALRAFDADGKGTYASVIRAIDWAVTNREQHKIRVLNLSLSAAPSSYYWQDPLAQAVMAAWDAGIVVVASASNDGSNYFSIGVPGNVPQIITVGATSDNYTPKDPTDDFVTTFSGAGPTPAGFVKPEVIAPGGHIIGRMPSQSSIALGNPDSQHWNQSHFAMSGTSQSAAVVSGVAALLLEMNPGLSPDDVKCRLIDSAQPVSNQNGTDIESVLRQGAGVVRADLAAMSKAEGCANQGNDVLVDEDGVQHPVGPVRVAEDGSFYWVDAKGTHYTESDGYVWGQGYIWGQRVDPNAATLDANSWTPHE